MDQGEAYRWSLITIVKNTSLKFPSSFITKVRKVKEEAENHVKQNPNNQNEHLACIWLTVNRRYKCTYSLCMADSIEDIVTPLCQDPEHKTILWCVCVCACE